MNLLVLMKHFFGLRKGSIVEQTLWKRRGQLSIQLLWAKICGRSHWKSPGGQLGRVVAAAF